MRLLVVGGSDAGIAAGLRARELDPSAEVTVLVADAYPNFSICGLPYYLSGDVPDWRALAHRTTADLQGAGLRLLLGHTARAINPAAKQVTATSHDGAEDQLGYDQLVVATGAPPLRPPIDGLDLPGVHVLHTMGDTFALHQALAAGAESAVVVGGGYISLEMAEAFTARGLVVTLVEQAPAVMPTIDPELGQLIGRARRATARPDRAPLVPAWWAWRDGARHRGCGSELCGLAKRGGARYGSERHGTVRPGEAWNGKARRRGKEGPGMARLGQVGRGAAKHGRARRD